jgi:hypothetical protein
MRKSIGWAAALLTAAVLAAPASAAPRRHMGPPPPPSQPAVQDAYIGPFNIGDPNVFWGGVIAGGAMTGTYFAIDHYKPLKVMGDGRHFSTGAFVLTTAGCMALAPMLSAALVWSAEHRPLTSREALGQGVGCLIPLIGPLLVDAAYAQHPEWTP